MVVARKAESKMEEAKDKVRARSAVTTKVDDSSKELSNQIAKLMAALTRAEQGNCPASAPNSPDAGVVGEDRWIGTLLPASAPTMVGLAWVRPPLLTVPLLQVQ